MPLATAWESVTAGCRQSARNRSARRRSTAVASSCCVRQDLFYQVARQVRHVYRSHGAEKQFRAKILPGEHSWDAARNRALGDFLTQHLGLERAVPRDEADERLLGNDDRCFPNWPAHARTTDSLAEQLTGRRVDDTLRLWNVFPPRVPDPAALEDIADRGTTREIFGQFEAFLRPDREKTRSSGSPRSAEPLTLLTNSKSGPP